jgi:lipoyl(octanoyl) transferase
VSELHQRASGNVSDRVLLVEELGRRPYGEVLEYQRAVAAERIAGTRPDTLILVEHDPVVTLGRSTKQGTLLLNESALRTRGIELFDIERGGDVTFHGPGQLIGYPVIDLTRHRQDLHWYLRELEQVLIDALSTFGITGRRREKLTGVWVEDRKIASIGVHARSWVTWHGFALNVSTDLSFFDVMVPCGISGVVMTTIAREAGRPIPMDDVSRQIIRAFGERFDLEPSLPASI